MTSLELQAAITSLTQSSNLSIAALSAPLQSGTSPRSSASSTTAQTPADLHAELAHYRDLFAKLRFSYTEQVTKEKLLKAVVADPPDLSSSSDNALLEQKLAADKATLKAKKVLVAQLLKNLEQRAREVARHKQRQEEDVRILSGLPAAISELQDKIAELPSMGEEEESDDPRMRMGLEATRETVDERRAEADILKARLREVKEALSRKETEARKLRTEMEETEASKMIAVREAVAVRERKEGVMDVVEARGRWDRAAQRILDGIAVQ